jgi:hypothetical protein
VSELRYVITDQIKSAVTGRETDVLDALGIDWRSGHPHIQCPYQDHTDNDPSWRWDERRSCAICTCTTNGHADGIFDVVSKVERIEFAEAKIRVAELLHRNDLIRTKSEGNGGQKTDAHSLLNAKSASRSDRLPFIYLAARLGIAEDNVPRPSTPVVGLKSLGYYDPPAKKDEKPELVGKCPCAVFGTVAADGRTHAHRIYLTPDGRGKAELGIAPNKKPRNPKKSAKIIGDDNTAGCSALWGDPAVAPHLVVFEGIENAAVGARDFKAEIDTGEIAIAAAITAGGIEAFQPYPATRRVTIGADRDEAPKNGKPGNRRGEIAARAFGLKHHRKIEVLIALPGNPSEKADWRDIFVRDGAGAVRNGILGASTFVPTEEEIGEVETAEREVSALQAINDTYPLPQYLNSLRLEYRYASGGRIMMHREKENPETNRKEWIPFATPFSLMARLRYMDEADAYGIRCVVQDMGGQPRDLDFDRDQFAKMAASDIRASLFRAGLRAEFNGEYDVVNILKATAPEREIIVVSRPGWHRVSGHPDPIFITPEGEIIGANVNLELAISARMPPDVARSGILDDWRAGVATAMGVTNCPHWPLGIAAGFAGPLICLIDFDDCGINLSGMTTSGKTLAQQMAASAWSSPSLQRKGLLQSAALTANGIEAAAARANGTVLALDELGKLDPRLLARTIYTATSGAGKQRLRPDGTPCERVTWSTFVLFSSELSLEEIIRNVDGGKWVGGLAVRITDVDVTGVDRTVSRDTLKAIENIHHHYGHAGPEFVRALIKSGLHRRPIELRELILQAARKLAGYNADSAKIRAAVPLALLYQAGALAQKFGLIPECNGALWNAVTWAWVKFQKSSDAEVLDPETQVVSNLQAWIAERWDVTIKNVDARNSRDGVNNREAVGWYDERVVYIPKDRLHDAAGKTLKRTQVANILNNQNLIVKKQAADRFTTDYVPKIGKVTAYALDIKAFGRDKPPLDVIRGDRDN